MNAQLKHPRGFTLVELVMAMAVGVVLLAAVSTAMVAGQRSSTGIERKVTTNQDARAALEIMAAEIRMASFNSLFTVNLWRNPADCSVSGNQTYKGIQEATATAITIEMDL
ncbi:MAG: PilW family protein, partial [Syntrophaceae bacterium]